MVSVDGRQLPLTAVALKAEAQGGISRVTLTQHFENPYEEPLQVSYQVPLPEDGVVAGYAFRIGEHRIVGEVDRVQAANERFTQALLSGRAAALLTQQRPHLFTQELVNVPPGQHVTVELTVDQRLRWLSEGLWEWRFPTVVAPHYSGTKKESHIPVSVAGSPTGIRATLELSIRDVLAEGRRPEAPSHPVRFERGVSRTVAVLDEGVPLDRDLVVRWPVATPEPGVHLHRARLKGRLEESAYGLLTLVPPSVETARLPRDLVVLMDVSGSMRGPPLEHAQRVVASLIDTLEPRDSLELLAFSDAPHRWKEKPVSADAAARREALAWVMGLSASGGTEMRTAIREALRPLRPASQRQVLLITDGQIGFEKEVVQELIEHLPSGTRLHTVGVGSAVNRSLTHAAARAGRGAEVLTGQGEDVERCTARLIAATRAPVLVDVTVQGDAVEDTAPASVTDLMAGAPALLSLKLRADGGRLLVKGVTPNGPWERVLTVPPTNTGEGSPSLATLYAREKVEDLSMRRAGRALSQELNQQMEQLGLAYQIATPLTAWVAVSDEPTVAPTAPTRHATVPQALPHGMSASGLERGSTFAPQGATLMSRPLVMMRRATPTPPGNAASPRPPPFLGRALSPRGPRLEPEANRKRGASPSEPAPVPLRGRWLASADGLDVVEIQCDTQLWEPGVPFHAQLGDGTRVTLNVDTAKSTRRTRVTRGIWVRLYFQALPREVVRLWWSFDGVTYIVRVQGRG
ncbi:VWA domain-containing protein [Pyxidicoccus parkwayensis]|uniref:VWA domain-containing protein n=1 Tax=Pyxidicoccus parkwayensis TaxID=2813578 RepID=A0ABX7NQR4_9BACT|nr:VIT and VWA domain-containing protein [Pyxidicoccus parkwaysis]QSQ21210.1 VWA domain-containing protein [Pyxidicoccus parkwaysis]